MCLAEALLRIPDAATRDALIRDKLSPGDWRAHIGASPSLFVNAATWGLVLTGRLVTTTSEQTLSAALTRLIARSGEPIIRRGVDVAMRLMGEQFVTGRTIEEAIGNSREREARGFAFSYDMLGEAATTAEDAARYLAEYERAALAIGRASHKRGIYEGPGLSIKLSALHPRYQRAKRARVLRELLPRTKRLAVLAKCLRYRPQHRRRGGGPARSLPRSSGGAVFRWRTVGLERPRLRHSGLQQALRSCRRLAHRSGAAVGPPADGPARQGRLLGFGDQAGAGRRARRLSRLHPQGPHRRQLPCVRPQVARRARRDLSAIRHPQRADARLRPHYCGSQLLSRPVRVPVPARHGRAPV